MRVDVKHVMYVAIPVAVAVWAIIMYAFTSPPVIYDCVMRTVGNTVIVDEGCVSRHLSGLRKER